MSEVRFQKIDGLVLSKRIIDSDERGSFSRVFEIDFASQLSQEEPLATCISSNKHAGTVRGLHIQISPFEERKWITCLDGSIFDVVLDLRRDSSTFGCWATLEMSADDSLSLEIPAGIAHGFQTLTPQTRLLYCIHGRYSDLHRKTINPFDINLNINWPLPTSKVSNSDMNSPSYLDYLKEY